MLNCRAIFAIGKPWSASLFNSATCSSDNLFLPPLYLPFALAIATPSLTR